MIEREDIIEFLGKNVRIGVPNKFNSGSCFYYYGKLVKVTFDSLKLLTEKNQTMFIRLEHILEFATEDYKQ